MKHIYDPTFRYTPSHETNIRATFERLRRERQDGVGPRAPVPHIAWKSAHVMAPGADDMKPLCIAHRVKG
jgi:hypothetical protein